MEKMPLSCLSQLFKYWSLNNQLQIRDCKLLQYEEGSVDFNCVCWVHRSEPTSPSNQVDYDLGSLSSLQYVIELCKNFCFSLNFLEVCEKRRKLQIEATACCKLQRVREGFVHVCWVYRNEPGSSFNHAEFDPDSTALIE